MISIKGDSFTAPSATASDPCEGSISVTVTSNVVPTVVGHYTVTYSATNKGNINKISTVTVDVIGELDQSGANEPALITNMIPVYWDSSESLWKKADSTNMDPDYGWYNYDVKKWANAVLVTSTNRATYLATSNGTTIAMNDILAFFVWLPRYKYMIPSGTGARTITIAFEDGTPTKSTGNAITTYLTHPAFTFGTAEETGIWVSKFEAGYLGATTEVDAEHNTVTSNKIISKPNVYTWRYIQGAHSFTVSRNMQASGNIYGLATSGIDTHMTKNSEWGAAAYLSYSIYGFNQEVWINQCSTHTTGCTGNSVSADESPTCLNSYESTTGQKGSTTGNIYGIYDMSGGTFERVMGNYNNYSGATLALNSNFNGPNGDASTTTGGYAFPLAKYYNKYTTEVITTACSGGICYGEALSETPAWNGDYNQTATADDPWLNRGGGTISDVHAGVFCSQDYYASASTSHGFRVVIVPTS